MNDYKELIAELRKLEHRGDAPVMKGFGVLVEKPVIKDAADVIEQLVRERNAAVDEIARCCRTCKHGCIPCGKPCRSDSNFGKEYYIDHWEWRGVQK